MFVNKASGSRQGINNLRTSCSSNIFPRLEGGERGDALERRFGVWLSSLGSGGGSRQVAAGMGPRAF
eukprot:2405024-Pyramimonas_sp.AAC.1